MGRNARWASTTPSTLDPRSYPSSRKGMQAERPRLLGSASTSRATCGAEGLDCPYNRRSRTNIPHRMLSNTRGGIIRPSRHASAMPRSTHLAILHKTLRWAHQPRAPSNFVSIGRETCSATRQKPKEPLKSVWKEVGSFGGCCEHDVFMIGPTHRFRRLTFVI